MMSEMKNKNKNNLGGVLSSLFGGEDMMTEIFLWLPLKSLVRFKRLSKRWHFLISHKDSYFRHIYLSTLSSTSWRRRNRIVGSSDDSAIMAGFFYQKPEYWRSYDRVRFLPTTSTQFKKYSFLPPDDSHRQLQNYNNNSIIQQGGGQQEEGHNGTTTTQAIEIINNINPFSSLDESLDKFLSCCLHQDQDSAGVPKKIFIAASSNGFLLCSLESLYPKTYYLVNPVTMEWVALPKIRTSKRCVYVGFVCNGDYPSLDLVGYTIIRISWLEQDEELLFEIFCDGDNQWTRCSGSLESLVPFNLSEQQNTVSLVPFNLSGQQNTVIVSTTGGGGGEIGIVVYFLVTVKRTMATAIAVFDCGRKDNLLQMIETPGPDSRTSVGECADYIRESDDGGAIHYVRICCFKDFEFWVLNTQSREWCLKHRASLETMMKEYPWRDIRLWNGDGVRQQNEAVELHHIHAFHPLNPNLIFLTLYGRMVCYNVQTGTLELVYDFSAPNMMENYCNYVYQWPCWPPLI